MGQRECDRKRWGGREGGREGGRKGVGQREREITSEGS